MALRFRSGRRRIAPVASALVAVIVAAGLLTQFATASIATSKSSGVLVIDCVLNSRLMDPQRENSSTSNIALHAMYDTLVTFKGTDYSKVLPSLATTWKVSDDGKSVTFNLRKGVVFSDGTP